MNVTRTIDSLGLGEQLRSEVDFVHLVERGFPVATVAELQRLGALSDTRRSDRLSPEQSDRVARAAGIFVLAHDTLRSAEKANDWMRRPNTALQGATPLSLLRTGSGAELVEQVLGRIAYGVYS
jgi:uncharacterized protein (DUF2384 family)